MFENVIQGIFSATFLAAILRVATPILLPSLAALISDKAGVIHIGLEGTMLASAFAGVVLSAYAPQWFGLETGRAIGPWLGLVGGITIGVLMALLLGFLHLRLKADLILAGIALNILGSAGTVAIMFELTGDRGSTSRLASLTMPFVMLPTFIRDIPLVGGFIYDVFNNQSVMTWIAFIAVFAVWFMLYRTPFGLHLRATGENLSAAQSVGIRAIRTRYYALMLSGALAAMGGIHMSMGYLNMFQRDMTAGRGFIALATPLLGGGNPYGTAAASLMFGFFDAFAIRIGTLQIPSQVPQMIPYVATVMALVIYALQTRQAQRLRALRATGGGSASVWRTLQRLSVLHVLLAMFAIIGIILSVGLFTAPNGFGGVAAAYPWGAVISLGSLTLIGINWPFIARLERILEQPAFSTAAMIASLTVYLGLFLLLFFPPVAALIGGLGLGLLLWAVLGGFSLVQGDKLKLHTSS